MKIKKQRNILAIFMAMVMVLSLVATNGVVANAASKKLKVTVKSKTVEVGKTITLKTNVKSNFKSSNEKIATVNSKGKVKGKKAGKVKITVTSKANKSQKKTVKITVIKPKKTEKTTEATTEVTTTEATTEVTTTEATTEVTTTEDVVKPVEKPTTESPAPQKPTSEEPTSEEPTSEEPTSEEPTSEEPTSEEKTVVGIEAEYKGSRVPDDIYQIGIEGVILREVYSDGTKEIVPITREVDDNMVFSYSRSQTIDGKKYGIWNIKYQGFSTEMTVEMVNVGNTVYSYTMILDYSGPTIKEGESISLDDISATIYNTDKTKYVLDDNTKLDLLLYDDLAKHGGNKKYEFILTYDYTFEDAEGNELYVNVQGNLYVPYE